MTWEAAEKAFRSLERRLTKTILDTINDNNANRAVSPCCKCAFLKARKELLEDWPKRLEKLLLKQTKAKRKGPVLTRHP